MVLTEEELRGSELFKRYYCATCRVDANLCGESYELVSLRRLSFVEHDLPMTYEDNGRFKRMMKERDCHSFKMQNLRIVELIWPYYYYETRATLAETVTDVAIYQLGVELTEEENAEIVAFLYTLTGEFEAVKLTNENVQE